jgi:hypothetical protein
MSSGVCPLHRRHPFPQTQRCTSFQLLGHVPVLTPTPQVEKTPTKLESDTPQKTHTQHTHTLSLSLSLSLSPPKRENNSNVNNNLQCTADGAKIQGSSYKKCWQVIKTKLQQQTN